MNRNKAIIVLIVILVLVAAGGIYFLSVRDKNDTKVGGNWDDPEYVFDIKIPEDFDEGKLERVNMKMDEARALFENRHEDSWAWITLGNLYEFVYDDDRAAVAYEKALDVSPYSITAVLNLASLYERHEDFGQAEYYYKRAIEVNSSSPDPYDRLAKFYYQKLKDNEKAEQVYLEGLQNIPDHPDLLVNIIRFYERTNNRERQVFYAKRLLELYPDNEAYKSDFGPLVN